MGTSLSPCASCHRHIQTTEAACPFCGAAVPEGFAAPRATAMGRPLSRAAILFATAAAVAGCSSNDNPPPAVDSGVFDSGPHGVSPVIPDGGDDGATPIVDGGPVAAYGSAVIDGGEDQ